MIRIMVLGHKSGVKCFNVIVESLNIDGQHLYMHQQNEQLPLTPI